MGRGDARHHFAFRPSTTGFPYPFTNPLPQIRPTPYLYSQSRPAWLGQDRFDQLFPSLQTLTIQPNSHNMPGRWKGCFLSNLQPKHIRITRIPSIGSSLQSGPDSVCNLYLSRMDRVEKLTIHIMDDEIKADHQLPLQVEWPISVGQIDFVFMAPKRPIPTLRYLKRDAPSHDFTQVRSPSFRETNTSIALCVTLLLGSAMRTGARIRIIGLGEAKAAWFCLSPTEGAVKEMEFRDEMRALYGWALKQEGMDARRKRVSGRRKWVSSRWSNIGRKRSICRSR